VALLLKHYQEKYYLIDMYRKRKQSSELNIFNVSELINKYNPVKIGIEVNGAGLLYFDRLTALHPDKTIEAIKTTAQSKPVMITRLILALEQNILIMPKDKIIIDEFLSFRNNGGTLSAISGKHDDIILALSFALAVSRFGKGGLCLVQ
jgi:phage terminase large subunit-like protein